MACEIRACNSERCAYASAARQRLHRDLTLLKSTGIVEKPNER